MKLGLLGLGSFSTLFYLKKLNDLYQKDKGGYSTCPLTLLNVDFNEFNPYLPDRFEKLKPATLSALTSLKDLGVKSIVVPNITLHETIDQLPTEIRAPIVHPLHSTLLILKKNNIKQLFIFGTAYSMQANYIRSFFFRENIVVQSPDSKDAQFINELRQKTYNGIESKTDKVQFKDLIRKYSLSGHVLLACTELSVLADTFDELPLHYDMVNLQINHAYKEEYT